MDWSAYDPEMAKLIYRERHPTPEQQEARAHREAMRNARAIFDRKRSEERTTYWLACCELYDVLRGSPITEISDSTRNVLLKVMRERVARGLDAMAE